MSDRAGDVRVTFVFHISCVGVSLFSLLTNIPLLPGALFLICQVLTPVGSKARYEVS